MAHTWVVEVLYKGGNITYDMHVFIVITFSIFRLPGNLNKILMFMPDSKRNEALVECRIP